MEKKVNFDIASPMMQDYLDKVSSRICGYHPSDDEYACEVMSHLRRFSIFFYKGCYDEIVRDFQKTSGHRCIEKLSKEDRGEMLQIEEKTLEASKGNERGLINAMLRMSRANKLCCTSYNYEETHIVFNWINNKNLFMVFRLVLRLNILLSETFPDTLKPQFEAWRKGEVVENPELTQEEEKKKKKGGNRRRNLFRNDKDKEEAVKCVLEYIQSQPDLATLKNEDKPLLNSCWTEKDGKLNKQILAFLIEWEKEEKIDFSAPAVFRFLKNDCSLKNDCEQNSFINKLLDNWNTRK